MDVEKAHGEKMLIRWNEEKNSLINSLRIVPADAPIDGSVEGVRIVMQLDSDESEDPSQEVLFDLRDLKRVRTARWGAKKIGDRWYALTTDEAPSVWLHHFILVPLGLAAGRQFANGDTLNCTRMNLEPAAVSRTDIPESERLRVDRGTCTSGILLEVDTRKGAGSSSSLEDRNRTPCISM